MTASESSFFAHLHVHSEYSLVDGSINIQALCERVKSWGQTHIALTDHANLYGAIEFYLAAKGAGLIPIVGCEVYHHLSEETERTLAECRSGARRGGGRSERQLAKRVFLAKDTLGYQSLLKLVSGAYRGEQLQDVPVVASHDFAAHKANLLVIESMAGGEFGLLVRRLRQLSGAGELKGEGQPAVRPLWQALYHLRDAMRGLYGDDYYLEVCRHHLPGEDAHIADLLAVSKACSLPVVATANAHYLDDSFRETHLLATALKNSITVKDMRDRVRGAKLHLRSPEEMTQLFADLPEALACTRDIAEACSGLDITMGEYYLPKIASQGETPAEQLKREAKEGLGARFRLLQPLYGESFDDTKRAEYHSRLDYELGVIEKMGFPDYFLIVADFIRWAKEQDIPVGPGRGSGAGSLVAYALQITDLDPIPYNLLFERFLNPERVSMPDFDVDFCQWRRDEVIQYCVGKYGASNVAQITTFGKLQAKAVVKAVGRVMDLGYGRVDRFTKLFPPDLGISLKQALSQEPALEEELTKDESLRECVDHALKLEGLVSHASTHAAGIVISDGDMTGYVPTYTTDGQSLITQYEMKPTEKVGLVKFDFLGLKTLTVIHRAVQWIRERHQADFRIEAIPLDDPAVFKLLARGDTMGVFQCESGGMTQLITKLRPSSFEDIIALVALFRPGPLGSGMVDDFVERKHGRQAITYLHPLLEPILKDTYGMILYQEQVQKIAAVLASYSLGEADLLRRAMGKKIPEEMAKQKDRFLSGAKELGIDAPSSDGTGLVAEEIFDLMAEFAKYGFNKSHSAAYGLVSYQTAYLKAHYPEEFFAAAMTCDMDQTEKLVRYYENMQRMGFRLIPPDLREGEREFVPHKKSVSFALTAIKGVGEGVVDLLLAERKRGGPYRSLESMAKRLNLGKIGKKTLQLLVEAGALDCFGYHRSELKEEIASLVDFSVEYHEADERGEQGLFASFADMADDQDADEAEWRPNLRPACGPLFGVDDLRCERAITGMFLAAHPLQHLEQDCRYFGALRAADICLERISNIPENVRKKASMVALLGAVSRRRTKKGTLMAYVRLEQVEGSVEALVFEKVLEGLDFPPALTPVLVTGTVDQGHDQNSARFMLDDLVPLERVRASRAKGLLIKIRKPEELPSYVLERMEQLAERNTGAASLHFDLHYDGCGVRLSSERRVNLSDGFFYGLGELGQSFEMAYLT